MEIDLYQKENNGLFVPSPAAIAQLERGFLEALDSPKIKDAQKVEVLEAVSAAIEKAWFELGLKQIPDNEMDQLKINVTSELYACFTCLTLREIGNAIYHGARGKYGKVYSITVIGVAKWFAEYMTDQNRLEAVKLSMPQLPAKTKPSPKERFDLDKYNTLQAQQKLISDNNIGQLGPIVYGFLNTLHLLSYSRQEKLDFMSEALIVAIADTRKDIALAEAGRIPGLKKQLDALIKAQEPGTAVPDDEYQLVIRTAKKLTVETWFRDQAIEETNIDDLLEAKREFYYQAVKE